MKKLLCLASAVLVLCGFLVLPERSIYAQSETCVSYIFPIGWGIDVGTNGYSAITGTDSTIVGSVSYTDPATGITGQAVMVHTAVSSGAATAYNLPRMRITSIYLQYFSSPHFTVLDVNSYLGSVPADSMRQNSTSGAWVSTTILMNGLAADNVRIYLHDNNSDPLALYVGRICGIPDVTPTPRPTLTPSNTPTPTRTPTPTPTRTPSITSTPTDTLTPTPTYTPGGPTDTPGPTDTDEPTSTGVPTATSTSDAQSITTGGNMFSTVAPPGGCDALNPCGALPFPVPGFATLSISTPPPYTAVSILPTSTLIGTPGGTGSETPTPMGTAVSAVVNYATQVSYLSDNLNATPGLLDLNGQEIDLRNAANQIGVGAGTFFGVVRGIQSFFLGKTGTIFAILVVDVLFITLVRFIVGAIIFFKKLLEIFLQFLGAIIP